MMSIWRMHQIREYRLQKLSSPVVAYRQEESAPQYGITGKVGGLKTSPNTSANGTVWGHTVTFVVLEATPLHDTQPFPVPLPPDVPVKMVTWEDPVFFNTYVAEVIGVWDQDSHFFEAEEVRIPKLGTIIVPVRPWIWLVLFVLVAFAFIMFGVIATNAQRF